MSETTISTKPVTSTGATESPATADVNTGRWTAKEHLLFVNALRVHGQDWRRIAVELKTRNNIQVRTHAQKYFKKLERLERRAAGFSGSSSRVPSAVRSATKAAPINKYKNISSYDEDDEDEEEDGVTETTASDSESSNGEEDRGCAIIKSSAVTAAPAATVTPFQPDVNLGPAISQQTLSLLAMLRPLPPPPRAIHLAQAGLPPGSMHMMGAHLYASNLVGSGWQPQQMMQQVGVQRQGFPAMFYQPQHPATLISSNSILTPLSSVSQAPIQTSQYLSTPSRLQEQL